MLTPRSSKILDKKAVLQFLKMNIQGDSFKMGRTETHILKGV